MLSNLSTQDAGADVLIAGSTDATVVITPAGRTPVPPRRSHKRRQAVESAKLPFRTRPGVTLLILVLADMAGFSVALAGGVFTVLSLGGPVPEPLPLVLAGAMLAFLALCAKMKLYPGVAMTPAQELRKLALAAGTICAGLLVATVWTTNARWSVAAAWLTGWFAAIIALCLARVLVYHNLAHRDWWGFPVVIIGKRAAVEPVIRTLRLQPLLGLKPVAVLDSSKRRPHRVLGVPVLGGLEQAHHLRTQGGVRYAIVAAPHGMSEDLADRLGRRLEPFPHLLLIPKGFEINAVTVVRNLGGMFGVELTQRLLQPANQYFKAAVDTVVAMVLMLMSLPLFAIIALLIKLDSRGPVFYRHTRIGLGGREFKALKFRTMSPDADFALEAYLAKHPELRDEWEKSHKLRDDPRVTRIGRLLRKPSLDELPQLWNVLKGEMSVIGPRPIVEDEIKHYNRSFSLYLKVKPGITGLWQVSGRSDTTYRERVCLDVYYVRNWSIWLDCYILARTLAVVLFGRGAY